MRKLCNIQCHNGKFLIHVQCTRFNQAKLFALRRLEHNLKSEGAFYQCMREKACSISSKIENLQVWLVPKHIKLCNCSNVWLNLHQAFRNYWSTFYTFLGLFETNSLSSSGTCFWLVITMATNHHSWRQLTSRITA